MLHAARRSPTSCSGAAYTIPTRRSRTPKNGWPPKRTPTNTIITGNDVNRHDDHIGSFVLSADEAIPAGTLDMFLELLRSTHGSKLLRLKGIVKLSEMPDTPVVVHGVQHVFHP